MSYPLQRTTYVTVKQFKERFNLGTTTVYRLIHMRDFPVKKFGKASYRIDLLEAEKFLEVNFN